jgi:hypothetical protein
VDGILARNNPISEISDGPWFDLAQGFGKGVFGLGGIVIHLQTDPESLGHAEEPGQSEAGIRSHRSLAGNDLTDAPLRNPDLFGQPVLGDAEGFEELLQQDFTWMRIRYFAHNLSPSMVIHNLNVFRTFSCPSKTDAELIIDTYAVLSGPAARQSLQPVAWRNSQIVEFPRPIQHRQLTHGHRLDIRETPDTFPFK